MATVISFEELEIWKLAREFAQAIFLAYSSLEKFNKDFELKNQINASSGSVMDNIAEGFERGSRNEFVNFLSFAKASAGEAKSQLYRALDRNYLSQEAFEILFAKATILCKKIGAFMKYLNSSTYQGSKFKNRTISIQNPKP
ncbi:MAG: four helix bundle protein [Bacteroidota bacterium]|nr:four helix bundle protein [Bacteroidota bacterium]